MRPPTISASASREGEPPASDATTSRTEKVDFGSGVYWCRYIVPRVEYGVKYYVMSIISIVQNIEHGAIPT